MIFMKSRWKKAAATVEYIALIIFVIGALVFFSRYILRGIWGKWRQTGDAFSHGRQYDPRGFGDKGKGGGTLECMFVYGDNNLIDCDFSGTCISESCYNTCIAGADTVSVICYSDCIAEGGLPDDCKQACGYSYCRNTCAATTQNGDWVVQPCFDRCMLVAGAIQGVCVTTCGTNEPNAVYCED